MKQNSTTQMLDNVGRVCDPISDADFNYGRVIGIKVASRTNPAIAEGGGGTIGSRMTAAERVHTT
jgi:hypothetical protein